MIRYIHFKKYQVKTNTDECKLSDFKNIIFHQEFFFGGRKKVYNTFVIKPFFILPFKMLTIQKPFTYHNKNGYFLLRKK